MSQESPKVFISYSWSSHGHQALVERWAEQLVSDGVDVVLDIYDLKEGHDKFAFMERMVTDKSVTHVLVVCDKTYSQKADAHARQVLERNLRSFLRKSYERRWINPSFIPIVFDLTTMESPFSPRF